ncbi:JmjC domain-containing protein 8 isoform X1 [Aix galericulata]|nr:JmjC domain-containing protein 8 isoform X1 [Aix galericulata]
MGISGVPRVGVPQCQPRGSPWDLPPCLCPPLPRFAFSQPVILRGVTDNSVSAGHRDGGGGDTVGGSGVAAAPVPLSPPVPQAFRALCTRDKLLAAYGQRLVRLSTANTYSYRKVDVPFQEYVEQLLKPQDPTALGSGGQRAPNPSQTLTRTLKPGTRLPPADTLYFFGDNNFTEWGPLFQQYVPPPFRIPGTSGAYSFGIAGGGHGGGLRAQLGGRRQPRGRPAPAPSLGSGSGVPFHWHGPGYSEVIFGRKVSEEGAGNRPPRPGGFGEGELRLCGVSQRWFLYPPDKTPHFHPNETTLAWLQHTYPTLPPAERPLECTVRPGEILYFPDRWWHATLNLDTSVFISTFLG